MKIRRVARRRSRYLAWLVLWLAVFIAGAGVGAGLLISTRSPVAPPRSSPSKPESVRAQHPAPPPRAFPPSKVRGSKRAGPEGIRTHPQPVRPSAQVAVIFDDAGGSLEDLQEIIDIGRPVTIAVLPGLRYSQEVANRARGGNLEVFLHLPLEPEAQGKAAGPGAITGSMTDDEIAAAVSAHLDAVPGATGVNNHMGSRGTADTRVMRSVLRVVKDRGLIFVDSRTSKNSVAVSLAQEMGIPVARRHVFLDNTNQPEAIRAQMRLLIALARVRGKAVAIGHANRLTPGILAEMLPEFDRMGVELVPVSTLVR